MTHKTVRRLLAGFSLIAPAMAFAANPGSGTLTIHEQVIEWSEGPNVGFNVTPLLAGQTGAVPLICDDTLPCDKFALTIDLPENLPEVFPTAVVRMIFSWDDITGAGVEDYDIYVYDAAGNQVGESATFDQPEMISELANGGITERFIDIIYFSNVGSTYTAKIELSLGEPAEGADLDAFFGTGEEEGESSEGFTAGLKAGEATGGQSLGAGGLGLFGLMLAVFGLRRRIA